MSKNMQIYDAEKVTVTVDKMVLFGFGDGDMVTCTKEANNIETKVDAQGSASAAILHDNTGSIQIDLAHTSPCNAHLMKLANSKKMVAVRVVHDGKETIGGSKAYVEKTPDAAFGKEVGNRSYTLKVLDYKHEVK